MSVFDFHSVHFSETKDFCEMFKIMKFVQLYFVLVLVLGPPVLVLVLVFDDIVLATRLESTLNISTYCSR